MPPFTVEYFCPRQGLQWQRPQTTRLLTDLTVAAHWADVLKPNGGVWINTQQGRTFLAGQARVLDARGMEVYRV